MTQKIKLDAALDMKSKVVNTRFGDIEYCSIGQGVPILFIHGGHSNCNETLAHKGFSLDKFQLITPSRPGYGKTPLSDRKTPKQVAELITALLEKISVDKIVVYGISAGGLTAIELASNYPNRVSKLILASAISRKWLDEQERTYKIAKIIFNPKVEKLIWATVRFFAKIVPKLMAKNFHSQFSKQPAKNLKSSDVKELISAMNHYSSGAGFLVDIDQDISEDVISKIKCPTLIIHSKNDNSVPIEHARHSNRMIQNSSLEILENDWGHLFWIGADSVRPIEKILEFVQD
ncbi:MAG: alpha/beta fold hydrolase [Leptolyngbyaceae cyanobacterium]